MLDRYKEILRKTATAPLETLTAWYSLYRMKEDPFLSPVPLEDIDYFVDRQNLVEALIRDVGVAARNIPAIVLLVGPHGFGRTTLLHHVKAILDNLGDEDEQFSFKGEVVSSKSLFELPEEGEGVQRYIQMAGKPADFLFVDDARPEHVTALCRHLTKTRLKVFAISPLHLEETLSPLLMSPTIRLIKEFDLNTTVAMLDKRIRFALIDKDISVSSSDLFEEEALKLIHDCSMGVPLLILKSASASLKLTRDMIVHASSPTWSKVDVDTAMRACRITKCYQARTEFPNLSTAKMHVLQLVFEMARSPTEIGSMTRRDRTTVSRHLNDLRELGLVEMSTHGRESMYTATEPTRIRFEIERMPKGGG